MDVDGKKEKCRGGGCVRNYTIIIKTRWFIISFVGGGGVGGCKFESMESLRFLGFGFFGLWGLDGTVSRMVVGATRIWNGRC